MNIPVLWPSKKQEVAHSTSAQIDVVTVFYCGLCHMCLLRVDLDVDGKCSRCHLEVRDISNSPIAKSWLAIVKPYPKKKKGGA